MTHIHAGGRVVHTPMYFSERWPCHIWLVDRIKFASIEAKLGGGSGPFSLSYSFSLPLFWEESLHD